MEQNIWNDPILSYNNSSCCYIKILFVVFVVVVYLESHITVSGAYSLQGPGKEHKYINWLGVFR